MHGRCPWPTRLTYLEGPWSCPPSALIHMLMRTHVVQAGPTCAECTGDASLLAGLLAGRLKPRTWPRPLVPSTVQPLGTYGTAAVEVGRGVVEDAPRDGGSNCAIFACAPLTASSAPASAPPAAVGQAVAQPLPILSALRLRPESPTAPRDGSLAFAGTVLGVAACSATSIPTAPRSAPSALAAGVAASVWPEALSEAAVVSRSRRFLRPSRRRSVRPDGLDAAESRIGDAAPLGAVSPCGLCDRPRPATRAGLADSMASAARRSISVSRHAPR